jgi:hypothetical protein
MSTRLRYRSSVPVRLSVSWERLGTPERSLIVQLGRLPAGAVQVPFSNFSRADLQQLIAGMRAIVSLSDECRFALGYQRVRERMKGTAKSVPSENQRQVK